MFYATLVDVTQAYFGFKCREIERKKEMEKEERRDGERDDDERREKRSSWIEGIRKLSQRWKDRRPSRHAPGSRETIRK